MSSYYCGCKVNPSVYGGFRLVGSVLICNTCYRPRSGSLNSPPAQGATKTLLEHKEALRANLSSFYAICATDSQFENEVRRLIDEIQPFSFSHGYSTGSPNRPRKDYRP